MSGVPVQVFNSAGVQIGSFNDGDAYGRLYDLGTAPRNLLSPHGEQPLRQRAVQQHLVSADLVLGHGRHAGRGGRNRHNIRDRLCDAIRRTIQRHRNECAHGRSDPAASRCRSSRRPASCLEASTQMQLVSTRRAVCQPARTTPALTPAARCSRTMARSRLSSTSCGTASTCVPACLNPDRRRTPITVALLATTTGVNFALNSGGMITGAVTDAGVAGLGALTDAAVTGAGLGSIGVQIYNVRRRLC